MNVSIVPITTADDQAPRYALTIDADTDWSTCRELDEAQALELTTVLARLQVTAPALER